MLGIYNPMAYGEYLAYHENHANNKNLILASNNSSSKATSLWYETNYSIPLIDIAKALRLDPKRFAQLNNLSVDYVFEEGSRYVVPRSRQFVAARMTRTISRPFTADNNTSHISGSRRKPKKSTPSISPPPPVSELAKVQRGDSLKNFLRRHGVTPEQLKDFNPGLKLSALTVGREVRVSKAATGQSLLAIRPSISGASWPDRPGLPPRSSNSGFPANPQTRSAMTPERQYVLDQIRRERAALQQTKNQAIAARRKRYKTFGDRTYDWGGWKLAKNGVRSTVFTPAYGTIRSPRFVAVSCKNMRTTTRAPRGKWSPWKIPTGAEEQMVVELCSQIKGAPRAF